MGSIIGGGTGDKEEAISEEVSSNTLNQEESEGEPEEEENINLSNYQITSP